MGIWWVKRDKAWGARTRIDNYPSSLGRFPTLLQAMVAYDRVLNEAKLPRWRYDRYLTVKGFKELSRHPNASVKKVFAYDFKKWVFDEDGRMFAYDGFILAWATLRGEDLESFDSHEEFESLKRLRKALE